MTETRSHEASRGGKAGETTEGAPSSLKLGVHLLVVLILSVAAALIVSGPVAAVSVALGIGLAALNLLFMRRIVRALTAASGLGALWALALPAKLVALIGSAYLLVQGDLAHPVPLAIGFALLPLSGVFLRLGGGDSKAPEGRAAVPRSVLEPEAAVLLSPGAPTSANPPNVN